MHSTNVDKGWTWACAAIVLTSWPLLSYADKDRAAFLVNEPPRVRELLKKAMEIESSASNADNKGRVATLYCEASRFGSLEAQYRLGLLYVAGNGVPQSREYAAALFSIAAQQGHTLAFDMLETVRLHSIDLPACMTEPVGWSVTS
jgi:TPR repeat protein